MSRRAELMREILALRARLAPLLLELRRLDGAAEPKGTRRRRPVTRAELRVLRAVHETPGQNARHYAAALEGAACGLTGLAHDALAVLLARGYVLRGKVASGTIWHPTGVIPSVEERAAAE